MADQMASLLGLGDGLTPAGDDLILGLLLILNRWGGVLAPGFDVRPLNRAAIDQARQKTTALSQSLIACAALGQADERLLLALDGIMTDQTDPPACAAQLAGWGSSSGAAALAGMGVGLSAMLEIDDDAASTRINPPGSEPPPAQAVRPAN
jgi:hypothetical protein